MGREKCRRARVSENTTGRGAPPSVPPLAQGGQSFGGGGAVGPPSGRNRRNFDHPHAHTEHRVVRVSGAGAPPGRRRAETAGTSTTLRTTTSPGWSEFRGCGAPSGRLGGSESRQGQARRSGVASGRRLAGPQCSRNGATHAAWARLTPRVANAFRNSARIRTKPLARSLRFALITIHPALENALSRTLSRY